MTYRQRVTPNLDPIIYSGKNPLKSWLGWCLAYVEVAFNTPRLYAKAWDGWQATAHKHADRNFPKNVYFPVWFSHLGKYNGEKETKNWGHVAIALVGNSGNLAIWSSPRTDKPYADVYSSLADVERVYSSAFVGWSEDIAGVRVIEPITGDTNMDHIRAALQAMNQAAHGKPMDKGIEDEKYGFIVGGGSWLQVQRDILEFSPWYYSLPRIIDAIYTAAGTDPGDEIKEQQGYELGEGKLPLSVLLQSALVNDTTADPALVEKAQKFDQFKSLFRGLMD